MKKIIERLKKLLMTHAGRHLLPADIDGVRELMSLEMDPVGGRKKIILHNRLSPGDILMLTAAVRDLATAHGEEYAIDVRTSCAEIWHNNPFLTRISDDDPSALHIKMEYPLINKSNILPYHFIHGFRKFLERQLDRHIPQGPFKGDIHLSEIERQAPGPVEKETGEDKPYWVIISGGKSDYTCKLWDTQRLQQVVDYMTEQGIQCVQVGMEGKKHSHPPLEGVVNMIGKTTLREFILTIYHSSGVICPVTAAMHLAAAVPVRPGRCVGTLRPCIVIAGGREPAHWEQYPGHLFLSTIGALDCCANQACWRSRVKALGDGDPKDEDSLCLRPMLLKTGQYIPACLNLITAEDVISGVKKYTNQGVL